MKFKLTINVACFILTEDSRRSQRTTPSTEVGDPVCYVRFFVTYHGRCQVSCEEESHRRWCRHLSHRVTGSDQLRFQRVLHKYETERRRNVWLVSGILLFRVEGQCPFLRMMPALAPSWRLVHPAPVIPVISSKAGGNNSQSMGNLLRQNKSGPTLASRPMRRGRSSRFQSCLSLSVGLKFLPKIYWSDSRADPEGDYLQTCCHLNRHA